MKWNIILSGLSAATTLAAPSNQPENAASSLEARDTPLWAANFLNAVDSTSAGFGRIQVQSFNETSGRAGRQYNTGPAIPVVTHPKLGKALKITLNGRDTTTSPVTPAQMRWEALPPTNAMYFNEGDDRYFRVDFVLGPDYPVNQPRSFNVINQIHQARDCCSPPLEFDISSGRLAVRGEKASVEPRLNYVEELAEVKVDTKYKLVYHVKFSSDAKQSLLEVWLNDENVLSGYQPKTALLDGGASYWKGATAYCHQEVPPLTIFQNAHRVGTTFASVNN